MLVFVLKPLSCVPAICFGPLFCCSHQSFSYKTCAVGTVKPCRLSSNSSFVRFLCKKKSPVVRTPPDDTPSHIGNLGDALDTQRLVFHFFCVHFLMEVGYSQTELSSVKKKKKTFRQLQLLWAWHQSKSVNALVLAYLLAVLKEKRAFSPSLNCSAH